MNNAFVRLVAASLKTEKFTLVDVGCSGGIEPIWRLFGSRFRAVGFDISVEECKRLAQDETHADVHYVAGAVDIPPSHPFARRTEGKQVHADHFGPRLSAHWVIIKNTPRLREAALNEKLRSNAWDLTTLADRRVYLLDTLKELHFDDVDLAKIDIDGPDFRVLNSLEGEFDPLGVLAVRMEVCMFGGIDDTEHTFHNTDRFMRSQGFDLVALDNRTYSRKALPARFCYAMPAQTVSGRIFQAEAFYARDPVRRGAMAWNAEKLAKLAAIYSIWNQPDGAAEILVRFRNELSPLFDVDRGLDLLAEQTQAGEAKPLSYRDYTASFEADETRFFPQPPPPPNLMQRLRAAWVALTDALYIARLEAARRGDSALARTQRQARQGDPLARYALGLAHEYGEGAERDLVQARMWYGLAVANATSDEMRTAFAVIRDRLGQRMTPQETARADELAAAWKAPAKV